MKNIFRVKNKTTGEFIEYGKNHKNLSITEVGKVIDRDQEGDFDFYIFTGYYDKKGKMIFEKLI